MNLRSPKTINLVQSKTKEQTDRVIEDAYIRLRDDIGAVFSLVENIDNMTDTSELLALLDEIQILIAMTSDLTTLIAMIEDLTTLVAMTSDLTTLVSMLTDLSSLISKMTDIDTLIAMITDLNTLIAMITDLNTLISMLTDITNMLAMVDNMAGVVKHLGVASTARPANFALITWIGSVEPTNAAEYDIWINTTEAV